MYQSDLTETIYYAGAAEYNTTGQLSRIATGEGMIYPSMKNGNQIFQYQYYLPDHLGNVRVLFNDRGDTLQNTDYYPYGLAITNKSLFGGQRYLYNGKEVQTETNEYDFGARFYDPSTGRWHTMDPMHQFNSPYNYVGGNPMNMIDPNGMWAGDIFGYLAQQMVEVSNRIGTMLPGVTVNAKYSLWQTIGNVAPLAISPRNTLLRNQSIVHSVQFMAGFGTAFMENNLPFFGVGSLIDYDNTSYYYQNGVKGANRTSLLSSLAQVNTGGGMVAGGIALALAGGVSLIGSAAGVVLQLMVLILV